MTFDPIIPVTCALTLSYVFVVAGFHKIRDIVEFKSTLENYQVVPTFLLSFFVYLIPVLELLTGIALIVPFTSELAAISASVLLIMYLFAMGINLVKGRRTIDCGCGGTEQKQNISEWLLLRNGVLLFFAYCVTATVEGRGLIWLDWVVVVLSTVIACLFYNIVNQLLVNKDLLKGLRSDYG
ncbi:MAG: putative membrane protein YphA (DoxX/SURF4 family) [Gammaproteobacteria bacterium]|jgi:uncharacterized membrane protein YphA (DoxX/SURF4 family)